MIFKNGIPVGYFEGLSLCERMESGFNFYYTFREGETAWIYARTLSVFKELLGVTAFSLDPIRSVTRMKKALNQAHSGFIANLAFDRPSGNC